MENFFFLVAFPFRFPSHPEQMVFCTLDGEHVATNFKYMRTFGSTTGPATRNDRFSPVSSPSSVVIGRSATSPLPKLPSPPVSDPESLPREPPSPPSPVTEPADPFRSVSALRSAVGDCCAGDTGRSVDCEPDRRSGEPVRGDSPPPPPPPPPPLPLSPPELPVTADPVESVRGGNELACESPTMSAMASSTSSVRLTELDACCEARYAFSSFSLAGRSRRHDFLDR